MNGRRLFVSTTMPRDGEAVYEPFEDYLNGRFLPHEIAIIKEVLSDIESQRQSKDYTVGATGNTVWLDIEREAPAPFRLVKQLYWRTSSEVP